MKTKILNQYASYNSVILDGKRVRRMRRTELSAEKIITWSLNQNRQDFNTKTENRSRSKDSSRSLPKVEGKWRAPIKSEKIDSALSAVRNEYLIKLQENPQEILNKQKSTVSSPNKSGLKAEQSELKSNEKSFKEIYESIAKEGESYINKNSIKEEKNSNSKNSSKNNSNLKSKSSSKKSFDDHSALNISHQTSNKSESIKGESTHVNKLSKPFTFEIEQNMNEYGLRPETYESQMIGKKESTQIDLMKENENSKLFNKSKHMTDGQSNVSNKQVSSGLESIADNFDRHFSNKIDKQESENVNFSRLKIDEIDHAIINNSSPKRESWREAIKSLENLNELDSSHNSQNKMAKQLSSSKKLELKIDSEKEENNPQGIGMESLHRNSWKHLPLASKEPSQRRHESFQDMNNFGEIKNLLENFEIHDYLVGLFNEFREEVEKMDEDENEKEVLCYLISRKHFLEKSNMIKALKGGRNIFNLTSIEIETEVLNRYIQHPEIKRIVKEMESANRDLFKKLEKEYMEVKQNHRNNPFIKLETPSDNFSKEIVRILQIFNEAWYQRLIETDDVNLQESLESLLFDSIEIVFVLSEMNGRPVKKSKFLDSTTEFDEYFAENEKSLLETYKYFSSLK